jgi:hypothetical protein
MRPARRPQHHIVWLSDDGRERGRNRRIDIDEESPELNGDQRQMLRQGLDNHLVPSGQVLGHEHGDVPCVGYPEPLAGLVLEIMVSIALAEHDLDLVVGVESGVVGQDVQPAAPSHIVPKLLGIDRHGTETSLEGSSTSQSL